MTTAVAPLPRILTVARACYHQWVTTLGFPLAITASSFVINLLIFASIGDVPDGTPTGGLASLYLVQFIVVWQGLGQYFSFAVGLNATRRAFYAATLLVVLAQSLLFALLLYALGIVERASDGWGLGLRFFDPLPATHSASPVTIAVYLGPMLLIASAALLLAAVGKRWGAIGVFLLTMAAILVPGGAAALVTLADGWPAVVRWGGRQSWEVLIAAWPLVPAALMAAGGWLVLRRAVP